MAYKNYIVHFMGRIVHDNAALVRGLPETARTATFLLFTAGLADGVLMPFFALWARSEGGIRVGFVGLLLACDAGGDRRVSRRPC